MDENLDEEMEIMEERNQEPKILNADTFTTPIKEIVPLKGTRSLGLDTTIGQAVEIMQKNKIGSVLITDEEGILKGMYLALASVLSLSDNIIALVHRALLSLSLGGLFISLDIKDLSTNKP